MGRPREQRILRRMPVRQPAVAFLEEHIMVGSKLRDEDENVDDDDDNNDDDDGEVVVEEDAERFFFFMLENRVKIERKGKKGKVKSRNVWNLTQICIEIVVVVGKSRIEKTKSEI